MSDTISAQGGCHCGAVRFAVRIPAAPALLDCSCSICRKTGFLHLIAVAADFSLMAGEGELTEYRFGTSTARHLFSRRCGIKSFYVPRSHPDGFSVNWRALDSVPGIAPRVIPFEGVEWERGHAALQV